MTTSSITPFHTSDLILDGANLASYLESLVSRHHERVGMLMGRRMFAEAAACAERLSANIEMVGDLNTALNYAMDARAHRLNRVVVANQALREEIQRAKDHFGV
jgi:hypothetical protein